MIIFDFSKIFLNHFEFYDLFEKKKILAPPTSVAPPPPPPEISSDYGYSAGPNTYDRNQRGKGFNQSNHRNSGRFTQNGGYGRQSGGNSAPPPPPPPPEIRDDIPMPPEYSYPRHLEPDIARHAKAKEESERAGWKRKTDSDYEEDMKRAKSDPESVGNALSKAAERAKAINSKLGMGQKSAVENIAYFLDV